MDIQAMLLDVINRKRKAFYAEAVDKGIITQAQAVNLLVLHAHRDAVQAAVDRARAGLWVDQPEPPNEPPTAPPTG